MESREKKNKNVIYTTEPKRMFWSLDITYSHLWPEENTHMVTQTIPSESTH